MKSIGISWLAYTLLLRWIINFPFPEDEEDDKPRPPEDDSVPDMEESFTTDGVGHDVDEYINNNISNDEVSNLKLWSHIKN